MPEDVNVGIKRYIQLRDTLAARKKVFEEENKPYVEALERLENWLLDHLNTAGANHVATESGTVYKVLRSSVAVRDWEVALSFIKEHELWGALERRVSKEAVQSYMEENKQAFPGVELNQVIKVNVRR